MSVFKLNIIIPIGIAAVLLLIFVLYRRLAFKFAFESTRPSRTTYGAVMTQEIERNHIDPELINLKYDKLFLINKRGQELAARLYPAKSQTDRYILFVHGYNYPWIGVMKYLPMLLEFNFNVLVPDMQAQGESEGEFVTFGALESDDCLEWLEQIQLHSQGLGFERARIGIMGESMGAVTALLATAKANSPLVAMENKPLFCVADCPFSSWNSMMILQGKKRYRIDPSLLLPRVRKIIKERSGADMNEVNAVKAASEIRVPVLLFHGNQDRLVPSSMSKTIADANPNITFCCVDGAKHMNCITVAPQEYRRRFKKLLEQVKLDGPIDQDFVEYL